MSNTRKLPFGEWLAEAIKGAVCAKVTKIGGAYFDVEAVARAAAYIDRAVFHAKLEDISLNPLEMLMIEVLIDQAGFKGRAEAHQEYQAYLKSKD